MEATLFAIRAVVEAYVSSVAPTASAFGFLTLVPWSSGGKPANVLSPGTDRGELNSDIIARMVEQHEALVIPSVYRTKRERRGLANLLRHVGTAHPDALVFLVQLPDRLDAELTKDYLRTLMARQDELHGLGASGVLMELEGDPEGLQQKIRLELQENAAIRLRTQLFVSSSTEGLPSPSECQAIEDGHGSLLWQTVPRLLMPDFAPLDDRLLELRDQVGNLQLLRRIANRKHVVLAVNEQHENVVVKVYNKRSVAVAEEVECIYREFSLLKHTLDHPHIVRCAGMLHSQCRVYLVLQYAGEVCMEQVLSTQPGYRLATDDALNCTTQVASALLHCHAKDVTHGQVSLRHVSVEMVQNRHICRLVDFSMAAHVPNSGTRKVLCGALPCVAPEMALEESYLPKPADCWSLGVVLLEIACGQGSLELSVRWRRDAPLALAARQIFEFFAQPGSHDQAMRQMGGVHDGTTSSCLEALLRSEPLHRASALDAIGMLPSGHARSLLF